MPDFNHLHQSSGIGPVKIKLRAKPKMTMSVTRPKKSDFQKFKIELIADIYFV